MCSNPIIKHKGVAQKEKSKHPWPLGGLISGNFKLALPYPALQPAFQTAGQLGQTSLGAPFPKLQNGKAPLCGPKPSKL